MSEPNKYRTDQYGSVYEYDDSLRAYVFIGKLNGDTLEQFLNDMYNRVEH